MEENDLDEEEEKEVHASQLEILLWLMSMWQPLGSTVDDKTEHVGQKRLACNAFSSAKRHVPSKLQQ